jgi:hypothetical protein
MPNNAELNLADFEDFKKLGGVLKKTALDMQSANMSSVYPPMVQSNFQVLH